MIKDVQFYLHHVLGREKECEILLFYNQSWNSSNWHVMSIGDNGSDGESKISQISYNIR